MSTKTLPDVQSREQRTLSIIAPNFSPDNVIISSEYPGAGRDRHYPVEVRRKDLLAALGAEPDESDYAEVVEENNRLSRKLSAALRERDAARAERDAARARIQALLPDRDSWKSRAEEATKDRDAAERMAALWKEATREHVGRSRTALSWAQMCEESLRTTLTRAEKAEKERDDALEALRAAEEPRDDQDQIDRSWALEKATKDRDAAERERDDALEALRAAEELREDQGQIDRSWALERAGEVLGRLAAVGIDAKACGVSLLPVAEWILGGEAEDRG